MILAAAATKVFAFDWTELPPKTLAASLLAVGSSAAVTGLLRQRSVSRREVADPLASVLVLLSAAACVPAALLAAQSSWRGVDLGALSLLALGAGYGLLAALAFTHQRDVHPALGDRRRPRGSWSEALSGPWLVLAWAALAVLLVALAEASREVADAHCLGCAGWSRACPYPRAGGPTDELFVASPHPGDGGRACCSDGGSVGLDGPGAPEQSRTLPNAVESRTVGPSGKPWAVAMAVAAIAVGVGALYAASLVTLEASQAVGTQGVAGASNADTPRSARSGVSQGSPCCTSASCGAGPASAAGLAIFAISLVKLFVYDLTFLTSITRALSFLAVGFLLLVGGFSTSVSAANPNLGPSPNPTSCTGHRVPPTPDAKRQEEGPMNTRSHPMRQLPAPRPGRSQSCSTPQHWLRLTRHLHRQPILGDEWTDGRVGRDSSEYVLTFPGEEDYRVLYEVLVEGDDHVRVSLTVPSRRPRHCVPVGLGRSSGPGVRRRLRGFVHAVRGSGRRRGTVGLPFSLGHDTGE